MGRTPRENRCGILSKPGASRSLRPSPGEVCGRTPADRGRRARPPEDAGLRKNTFACLAACLLSLSGCSRQGSPEDAWRRYLSALCDGRTESAFDGLSKESRTELAALEAAALLAPRADGAESASSLKASLHPRKPGLAYFQQRIVHGGGGGVPSLPGDPWNLVERIEVLPGRARITSRTPLGAHTAELVLEDGRYRIVLELP